MKSFRSKHHLTLDEWKKAIFHVSDLKKEFVKLQNQLYEIVNVTTEDETHYRYTISFNTQCAIYSVHFPSVPITPVSCMIEIAQELAEEQTKKSFMLKIANDMQVIMPHNPTNASVVDFCFTIEPAEEGEEEKAEIYSVSISIRKEDTFFMKMLLHFEEKPT